MARSIGIKVIAAAFGYRTEFVRESALVSTDARGTDRLVSLCLAVGADAYLSGDGASGYQDDAAFPRSGLGLIHQQFTPTPYGDMQRFVPGLSAIDWLMFADR